MKRRPLGRDLGLSIRMAIAFIPVVLWYVGLAMLLVFIVLAVIEDRAWRALPGAVLFLVAAPLMVVMHVRRSEDIALRAAGASLIPDGGEPELRAVVARVAAQADLPPPRIAVARSSAPNAFSAGVRERTAVVAFTTELLRRRDLTTGELEAVVAHELAHVANRDGVVMTIVSVPALVGTSLWNHYDVRAKVLFGFYSPFFVVGLLLMWTLSRYREYVADRGAVLITGAPEQLMSALQKLAGEPARGDLRGGLAVQALCIVAPQRSQRWRRFELFSDHPPLRKRLDRLAAFSRELGKVT